MSLFNEEKEKVDTICRQRDYRSTRGLKRRTRGIQDKRYQRENMSYLSYIKTT
jgi:hypothetical protein